MHGFKFIIPLWEDRAVPSMPGYTASGCAAFVIAATREDATATLGKLLAETGNVPWHLAADVSEVPLDTACVALLAQT